MSKEAMPILRREKHLFKIVTIYVVDKYNFNLQKLQRVKEVHRASSFSKQEDSREMVDLTIKRE